MMVASQTNNSKSFSHFMPSQRRPKKLPSRPTRPASDGDPADVKDEVRPTRPGIALEPERPLATEGGQKPMLA